MLSFLRKELGCLFLIILFIVCIIGLIILLNVLFSIDFNEVKQAFIDWYNNTINSFKALNN